MKLYKGEIWWVALVCLAAVWPLAGCKKSAREIAEQKALERHERETVQKNGFIREIKGPYAAQMMDGLHFLGNCAEHNRLPGISGDAQGDVRLSSVKTEVTPAGRWFLTEEVHISISGSPPLHLGYVLVQTYSNADFQLKKAWRMDASGKIMESFPVPEPSPANPRVIFLGPANPGAELGMKHWHRRFQGGGSVSAGGNDPATGCGNFKIGVAVAAPQGPNQADLRSDSFSVERSPGLHAPLTFSCRYKLPGKVKPGDNLDVDVRFFGPGDDNFLGQEVFHMGSSTGDSEMSQYKTMTVTNIVPTPGAVKADIWVVANIGGPWTSGDAEFDDFSLTAVAPRRWGPVLAMTGFGLFLGTILVSFGAWAFWARRRSGAGNVAYP